MVRIDVAYAEEKAGVVVTCRHDWRNCCASFLRVMMIAIGGACLRLVFRQFSWNVGDEEDDCRTVDVVLRCLPFIQ